MGIHREQEGIDVPYKAELAGASSLSLLTQEVKGSDPISTTHTDIDGHLLFLIGRIGVGPDIGYKYTTTTEKVVDTATQEKTSITTRTSRIRAGLLGKYYFANIDKALTVPFVLIGASYQAVESKTEKSEATKGSGSYIRLGTGLDMFLDSNIAASPQIEYIIDSQSSKAGKDAATVSSTTSGIRVLLELATFL